MIWLTWRQHRKQALYTLIAMVAVAAVMLPTGLSMHNDETSSGLAACLAKLGTAQLIPSSVDTANCISLSNHFQNKFSGLDFVAVLFVILPLFVGLFFGAPLVSRELEHGTHRLVWTQGVSRLRWALSKFGLVGGAALVVAVLYALGVSWWFGPLVSNGGGRLSYLSFDVQGVAPIGYTLFAVALGVYAGTVCRKVLPAMGVTLGGFVGVRVLIEAFARPHFLPAETLTYSLTSPMELNPAAGDWIYNEGVRNAAGQLVSGNATVSCPPGSAGPAGSGGAGGCLGQVGLNASDYNWQLYQPGSRFWEFQGIETGIFLALTAVLLYLALRTINRLA